MLPNSGTAAWFCKLRQEQGCSNKKRPSRADVSASIHPGYAVVRATGERRLLMYV
jgi:hypothetical protein